MQWYFIFDYSVSVPGHLQTWKNLNILYSTNKYIEQTYIKLQPQIRKSWDSMENANKKRK